MEDIQNTIERIFWIICNYFFSILIFRVICSIDVLDPENQPGSGKIRTGTRVLGLTEDPVLAKSGPKALYPDQWEVF